MDRQCGPTAGTNILKYWYGCDPVKYANLSDNKGWKDAFVKLAKDMGHSNTNGTYLGNYAAAVQIYFYTKGFSCSSSYSYFNDFNSFKTELDANRPVTLLLQGHVRYGNHFVLALGYLTYKYNYNNYSSEYFRISDCWSYYPDRFVHYRVGVNCIYKATFNPS